MRISLFTLMAFGLCISACKGEEDGFVIPGPPTAESCELGEIFADTAPVRLLTRVEWDATVSDLLEVDTDVARRTFARESSAFSFENDRYSHQVTPLLLRQWLNGAEEVAQMALDTHGALAFSGCERANLACGPDFVERFGKRAFRRPLLSEEASVFKGLFAETFQRNGFEEAVSLVIQAALQSPQFVYRLELASADARPADRVLVDDWAMASRLSYFLWGTMPDDVLFDAAQRGELRTAEQVEEQVLRMLDDPRSAHLILDFYRQWLALDALQDLVKDEELYPEYEPEHRSQWRASMDAFLQDVHAGEGTLDELLLSRKLFLSRELGQVYGVDVSGDGFHEIEAPETERAGLLTQPGLLALLSTADRSSPIMRGLFVREELLCQPVPSPPDAADLSPPDPDLTLTTRDLFAQHAQEGPCAGCHSLIDPPGFMLEGYDAMGRFRTTENDLTVDTKADLIGPNMDPMTLDGAVELATALAEMKTVSDCVSQRWYEFSMGRPVQDVDLCSITSVKERFYESGRSFDELMVTIATSDAFRYRTIQYDDGGAP